MNIKDKEKSLSGNYLVMHKDGLCINITHLVPCSCNECKWYWYPTPQMYEELYLQKPTAKPIKIDMRSFLKKKVINNNDKKMV